MRLRLARIVCSLALMAAARPAAADDPGAIAVLPFTSSVRDLEIYGLPVARALTGELRGAAGAPVQSVADPSSLPRRIDWVIDGRIVDRGGGQVVIEARLRDPDRGSAAGQAAAGPGPLRQIDRLAGDLARELLPVLAVARARRARSAGRPAPLPPLARSPARRVPPMLLVGRAGGRLASGLSADPVVTSRAAALAARLGRRAQVVELGGIAPAASVVAALAGARASHALLSEVQSIEFSWLGVLAARGRVRLVLVDAAGGALFDSTIETDTVVGSRGDRHEALLGFVARQAMEIAAPRLRRILAP